MERAVEASTIVDVGFPTAAALLGSEPAVALPNPTTLAVGALHRQVVVTLDDTEIGDDVVVVPVEWHAAEQAAMFPVFCGTLQAEASAAGTRLRLAGTYTVPLGLVGRFGDGLVGRRVVHQALRSLVTGIAGRVAVALGAPEAPVHAVDVRDVALG